MKIYDTWAIAAKRNDTDVKYVETCNLQSMGKLWLAEWKQLLTIIYSIYNSNDQWRFFNPMECDHRGKGEGNWAEKKTILRRLIFLDRSLS